MHASIYFVPRRFGPPGPIPTTKGSARSISTADYGSYRLELSRGRADPASANTGESRFSQEIDTSALPRLAISAIRKRPRAEECQLGCSVQEVNGGDLSPRDEDDIDQSESRSTRASHGT